MSKNILNIALAQYKPSSIKTENFSIVTKLLKESLKIKPNLDLFILPECFTSPYSIKSFRKNCEIIPNGETYQFLQKLSKENNINVVGGSIPEKGLNDSIFNTTMVFNKNGEFLTKYRKMHLFDVDIPNKISFQESKILTKGDSISYFKLPNCDFNIGLGICYDIRFPELASVLTRDPINSKLLIYPGAFNTTTGPLHWETLVKSRALDNQCFVAVCSPARDLTVKYHAYGHSMVVSPMGQILSEADENEAILYASIDLNESNEFRENIPLHTQRRFDLYGDVTKV